jgi:xanthine dehydrogenase accessory factor
MRPARFFDVVSALTRERRPFAVATVVGRRAPVSAHLGDRAIIHADGRMEGFVGGACSRELVRKQALEAIRDRQSRLVSIRPDAETPDLSDPEHVTLPMRCVSEGGIDVYVEPIVAARRLVVVGATPVAGALARLAVGADYDVVHVVEEAETAEVQRQSAGEVTVKPLETLASVLDEAAGNVVAVVASQGHYDEEALETILGRDVPYVGLVASRKRGDQVRATLEQSGVQGTARVRYPAGLDLKARTPAEIALSILAELVQVPPAPVALDATGVRAADDADAVTGAATARDPVCGMEVAIAGARHVAEVDGMTFYFCCAGCRSAFLENRQAHASSMS